MHVLSGWPIFSGYVSFREGNQSSKMYIMIDVPDISEALCSNHPGAVQISSLHISTQKNNYAENRVDCPSSFAQGI